MKLDQTLSQPRQRSMLDGSVLPQPYGSNTGRVGLAEALHATVDSAPFQTAQALRVPHTIPFAVASHLMRGQYSNLAGDIIPGAKTLSANYRGLRGIANANQIGEAGVAWAK